MSAADESLTSVWNIGPTGGLSKSTIHNGNIGGVVRPVITINKSYLN